MSTPKPAPSPTLESIDEPQARGAMPWLLLILVATLGVYWQSTAGELVYDDLSLIAENPLISDLGNIPELLLRPLWDFQNPGSDQQTGYWRPLTSIVYSLAWAADEGAPRSFHWASILMHLAASVGAFCLARRLAGASWIAGCVALLFGLHPLHVESVAWISALNDPLFASFVLFSLASFARWRQRGSRGAPLLAALCFGLALLSKEMALALLPLLILVDLYIDGNQKQSSSIKQWFRLPSAPQRAYLPFAVVLGAYIGMRMWVFSSPMAGFDRVITHFGVGAERMALLRVELWGGALELLFWPSELKLFRPFQPNLSLADSSAQWALGLTLVSLLGLGLGFLFKRRALLFSFLIIPISFAPVLYGADAVGLFPCSDRYLYLAVFGAALFALLLMAALLPKRLAIAATLLMAAVFGQRSFQRTKVWQSELHLFGSEAKQNMRSPYVYWGYGRVLLNEYSKTLKISYLEEAKRAFENSQLLLDQAKRAEGADIFASSNDYLQANLGYAHCFIIEDAIYSEGSADTSIALLNSLLDSVSKIHQEAEEARSQGKIIKGFLPPMELIFAALGSAHFTAGDYDKAAAALRQSLQLNPRNAQALKTLAKVDFARGSGTFAIRNLRLALEIAPRSGDLQLALAQLLQNAGQTTEALELAENLLSILPEHPGPLWVMADALMQADKPREALIRLREAQRIDEFNGHTWLLIAQAMNAVGTDPKATLDAFRKAATYKPGDVTAQYNLAALLHRAGFLQEALPHFTRAYALASEPQTLRNLRTVLPSLAFQNPEQLLQLAQADRRRDQFDLMELWLTRALALDSTYSPALMDMGRLMLKRERTEEGLDFMEQALRGSASFADLIEYGQFQAEAGHIAEARISFEKARLIPLPKQISEDERMNILSRLLSSLKQREAEAK